jgi:alpha-L-rhamnosidase
MITITHVFCDGYENSIGLDTPKPTLSWRLASDENGTAQTAYEIETASDEKFSQTIWQSGPIESSQSQHLTYSGPELKPHTRYWFRIRVRDNTGNLSNWSDPIFVEPALLNDGEWGTPFISSVLDTDPNASSGWYFRKTINLSKELCFARAYATALGVYELNINNFRCGNNRLSPGWTNYNRRLLYQSYDITRELAAGENTILLHAGPGWYKGDIAGWIGKRCFYGNRTAVSMLILLAYTDGTREWIRTGSDWKSSPSAVSYAEIYHGEKYDAGIAKSLKNNLLQWTQVEEVSVASGLRILSQDGPLVLPREELRPKALLRDSEGKAIIDFGQNLTGWVRFTVSGEPGDRVHLRHAEILHPEGEFYTANLRSARQEIEYILSGDGTEEYQPFFTFQGFRYVRVEEYPGELRLDNFTAVVVHSAMEETGRFACSIPLLNQLHHNIKWGMKGNFLDIPTDCPQRDERLGWTGDAQVFIRTACLLMNTTSFFRKWLRDMRSEQLENGGIPFVIPDVLKEVPDTDEILAGSHSSTGWGDAMTICPWELYLQSGDIRILQENYTAMSNWVAYMRREARNEAIWDSGFHFGDWVAIDAKEGSYFGATPNDFTATVFYANSVDILRKTAQVLGKADDELQYAGLYEHIAEAFREEYFTHSGRLAVSTQTAHALALHFKLTPKEFVPRTVDSLVRLIEAEKNHLTTGFLGTPYLCAALSENGRPDVAYRLLLQEDYPSWLYQVKQGATTIWEHWDGIKPDGSLWSPDMNSFNHYAYGSVGAWLYNRVAGISEDEHDPGYRAILFEPLPDDQLTYAESSLNTPYGEASIRWEKLNDSTVRAELKVPVNAKARFKWPWDTEYTHFESGLYRLEKRLG